MGVWMIDEPGCREVGCVELSQRIGRVSRILLCLGLLFLLTGCGAVVRQTIFIEPDGSGHIEIKGTDQVSDINEYAGGVEQVTAKIQESLLPGWSLEVTRQGNDVTFILRRSFATREELTEIFRTSMGEDVAVDWVVEQTPFYQAQQLGKLPVYQVWAPWAVKAVQQLTNQSVVESVSSYVQWPGQEARRAQEEEFFTQQRDIPRLEIELDWSPRETVRRARLSGLTGDDYFMPVKEWLSGLEGAQVEEGTEPGSYEVSFAGGMAPWSDTVPTVTQANAFWNLTAVTDNTSMFVRWLGDGVRAEQLIYKVIGSGYMSANSPGEPPAWYKWPWPRRTTQEADLSGIMEGEMIVWYFYTPRPALYAVWGTIGLAMAGFIVAIPLAIRRRDAILRALKAGGERVSEVVQAQMAEGSATRMTALSLGQRLKALVTWQPLPPAAPLSQSLVSLGLCCLVLSAMIYAWVRSLYNSLISLAMDLGAGRADLPDLGFRLFGWTLLILCLSVGLTLAVLYPVSGRRFFPALSSALADAHWTTIVALLASVVLGRIWTPCYLAALVGGMAWGQAVLARGLADSAMPFTRRLAVQWVAGIMSMFAPLIVVVLGLGLADKLL